MILINKLFLNIVFNNRFVVNSVRTQGHIYRIIKTGVLTNFDVRCRPILKNLQVNYKLDIKN